MIDLYKFACRNKIRIHKKNINKLVLECRFEIFKATLKGKTKIEIGLTTSEHTLLCRDERLKLCEDVIHVLEKHYNNQVEFQIEEYGYKNTFVKLKCEILEKVKKDV